MRLWVLAAVAAAERNASRYVFEGNLTQEERAMAEGCARCAASRETVLGAAVRGDALGRHLSITVVPEVPFVIVDFDDRGVAAPPKTWGGICLEILQLAASRANFTYDLRLATGHVPGTPDYGTAQADVEGGESDAYLGAFFVTPGRLAKSRMTTPFMGSVGVGLAVEWQPPAKKLDANALAFAPFKADLWAAILVVLFVAAPATFWFLEAPSAARGSDFEEAPGLSWRGLRKNYIHSAWLSWSTFTQAGSHSPKTGEGRVFSAGFTFFTLVTVALYTAQLTALLVSSEPQYAYTSVQGCARQGGQKLCAKDDTAYLGWLRERYADADVDIIAWDGGHKATRTGSGGSSTTRPRTSRRATRTWPSASATRPTSRASRRRSPTTSWRCAPRARSAPSSTASSTTSASTTARTSRRTTRSAWSTTGRSSRASAPSSSPSSRTAPCASAGPARATGGR